MPNSSLPKSARVLKRGHFQKIMRSGARIHGLVLAIHYRHRMSGEGPRLGITVSKRYGKAHERNRFKRVIREAFRLCRDQLPSFYDLNILPIPDLTPPRPSRQKKTQVIKKEPLDVASAMQDLLMFARTLSVS